MLGSRNGSDDRVGGSREQTLWLSVLVGGCQVLYPKSVPESTTSVLYDIAMSGKTIALDLESGNLIWLEAQARSMGRRSVSEVVNKIITRTRAGSSDQAGEVRSVVGRAQISEDDPDLQGADAAVRALFDESQARFPRG